MARPITLPPIGSVFGQLTVDQPGHMNALGRMAVGCICSCGGRKDAKPSDLRRGVVTSCGCAKLAILLDRNARMATHRMSATPEHHIWRGMLTRCLCKTSKYYPRYGGRGITVCDRWKDSFESFYADMGPRPSRKHTVERKLNDGPYSPGNCTWATHTAQNRNRRNNRLLTFQGETKPVSQWAVELGLQPIRIFNRLRRGYSTERALSTTDFRRASGLQRNG